jgi:hypothetical protein
MWLGEQITKRGVGNGISILIFASILASAPAGIRAWLNGSATEHLFFPIAAVLVLVTVVFVQEGLRKIPIQYARRMVGGRTTAGASTYMPLRVNMAGVIPVIFAAALLALPPTLAGFAPSTTQFVNRYVQPGTFTYLTGEALLIVAFTLWRWPARTRWLRFSARRLSPPFPGPFSPSPSASGRRDDLVVDHIRRRCASYRLGAPSGAHSSGLQLPGVRLQER